MNVDLRYIQQSGGSGLRQANPGAFVQPFAQMVQAGRDLQSLGQKGAELASSQQALANDNAVNQGLNQFKKEYDSVMFNAEYGEQDPADYGTNKPGKLWPIEKINENVKKGLLDAQNKWLKTIPEIRRPTFLQKTNAQILAARVKAGELTTVRINKDARAQDIFFKNNILANAADLTDKDVELGRKEYQAKLARGVIAGVYDADDAEKLLQSFDEDLSEAVADEKTRKLFQTDFTVEDLEKLQNELLADPNLKNKSQRADQFWTRAESVQRQRQTALDKVAEEKSEAQRIVLAERLSDARLDPTGESGITMEDVKEAIKNGLRHAPTIEKYTKIALKNEAKRKLGEVDDSPAKKYENELEQLEFNAIAGNWTTAQLKRELDKFKKKVRDEHANDPLEVLNAKELGAINGSVNELFKSFSDEGKRNLKAAKQKAEKDLKFIFGGSDQAFDRFNSKRNELVQDAIISANLLIDNGESPGVAVEKVRKFARIFQDEGIKEFKADQFKTVFEKAKKGKLTDDERFKLQVMVERRIKRRTVQGPQQQ